MSLNELLHASIFSSWILLFLEASDEKLFPSRFSQLNVQHKNVKLCNQTHKEQRGKWEMFHWGCSFSEYAGMMSFVFTKPSLNLLLPFKNCSRVHLWRLPAFRISGCHSARCIKIQPAAVCSLALPRFICSPYLKSLCAAWSDHRSAPSSCVITAEASLHDAKASLEYFKGEQCQNKAHFWSPTCMTSKKRTL